MANQREKRDEPAIAAAIVPMIAEVNALNRRILEQSTHLPTDAQNASAAIEEKINEIWGLLLAKDLTKLEIPGKAVPEIVAVIERHQIEAAAA